MRMNPVVVITGGSDGLGKCIAENLSQTCNVIILATNPEKLKEVATKISCDFYQCDVSNYKEVEIVMKQIQDKYHEIDVLINNAGLLLEGELENNSWEDMKKGY